MGSPPHTRGKVRFKSSSDLFERITPAHAGKSNTTHTVNTDFEDHPRTRGEKLLLFWQYPINRGSPPHTRGKDKFIKVISNDGRITPAHAGKRILFLFLLFGNGDHPRTRGEKLFFLRLARVSLGSPPHTRGKACFSPPLTGIEWDHPRTRGEKNSAGIFVKYSVGSPPHTRGKGSVVVVSSAMCRITPAHAGKRLYQRQTGKTREDHPRTRGEK